MAGQTLKPPFEYYGGKAHLGAKIAALLPPHEHYVEPFAGGLSVLLAKEPSRAETVNDLDGDLVTFWRVLRDHPEDLTRLCALTPHARDEFVTSQDRAGLSDLEVARRVFCALSQGRKHSLSRSSESDWRRAVDVTTLRGMPEQISVKWERIAAVAERLANVSIENRDALDLIRRYGRNAYVCIYADPPYLGDARSSSGGYAIDQRSIDFHREFAQACIEADAAVVISGYSSGLYSELFDGWHVRELKTQRSQGGTARTEVLWSNRPFPDTAPMFTLDGMGAASIA